MPARRRVPPRLRIALLSVLAACAEPADPAVAPDPPCAAVRLGERQPGANVVLVVSDAMRRDRVGVYGGAAATPAFDAFATSHLYFANASTQSPWTKPSVATLFTSLYPSQHGLASDPSLRWNVLREGGPVQPELDVLAGGFTTLAEVLASAGYQTAAFVSNPWMERRFGFDQGFESYDDSLARWGDPGEAVSRAGLEWIDELAPGETFFLYLHYIDAHQPYGDWTEADLADPPRRAEDDYRVMNPEAERLFDALVERQRERLPEEAAARLAAVEPSLPWIDRAYDRGVEGFDRAFAVLLEGLATRADRSRTAVLVTADHGEALFEHGYGNHGWGLYENESAVPLAADLPGASVGDPRVACSVGLIDVLPTLCDYLDVPCPEPVFGRSFLAVDGEGERPARYLVTEGVMFHPANRTIRNARYKLFSRRDLSRDGKRGYALYDLAGDPREKQDLLSQRHRTPESQRIGEALAAALREAVPPVDAPDREFAPVDPGLEDRLRELGYLESGPDEASAAGDSDR